MSVSTFIHGKRADKTILKSNILRDRLGSYWRSDRDGFLWGIPIGLVEFGRIRIKVTASPGLPIHFVPESVRRIDTGIKITFAVSRRHHAGIVRIIGNIQKRAGLGVPIYFAG